MTLARKIASNTLWQVFGKMVTAVLGIVSIKYVTNYLSPSTYGEYTIIYDFTAIFAIVADFGLFTISVREMAYTNTKEMVGKIVGNVLSVRTILAAVSLGTGALVAWFIPAYSGSHIPAGVGIVAVATILTLIAGTMSSVLQFYLRMRFAAISIALGKFITVGYILAVIFVWFPDEPDAGFLHLQFAWVVGTFVTVIFTYLVSTRLIPIRFQFDFSFWKTVLGKALPYGLALVLGTIYFRMGTLVLSLFGMKEQVGFYGVPGRFLEIIQILPHYFMGSVLPVLTLSLKENGDRAQRIVRICLGGLASAALPMLVGGVILAWPITAAVSSPEFLTRMVDGKVIWGSDLALKILLFAMVFTYLHVALSYALVAMGRQAEILKANLLVVIINITSNILLVPRFGFVGAAISAALAEFIMLIYLAGALRSSLRQIWDVRLLAKAGFSSLAMGLVLFFTAEPLNQLFLSKSLLILIPLGGLVYVGSMFLMRAVSTEHIGLLKKTDQAAQPLSINQGDEFTHGI